MSRAGKLPVAVRGALALAGIVALVAACNADIANLDPCHELAQAFCARLASCGAPGIDKGQCSTDLEAQCQRVNDNSAQDGAHDCALALGVDCQPTLPEQCANFEAAIGCNSCPSTAPTAQARAACCDENLFSAVCAGCP